MDELRAGYLRLARQHHPDKNNGTESETFLRIQKAFDRARKRLEEQGKASPPQEVDLDDMEFDELNQLFSYGCRCGERIMVSCDALADRQDVFTCHSCSLRIKALYEVDEIG